jgi:hypothetical protein
MFCWLPSVAVICVPAQILLKLRQSVCVTAAVVVRILFLKTDILQ